MEPRQPENNAMTNRDEALAAIAANILDLETLEARNSDGLDFHELAVWRIKAALEAAFAAGQGSK